MSQKTSKQDNLKLQIKLKFPSNKKASIAKKAAMPETNPANQKRSKTSISIKNTTLSINITAQDKTALRASANSCLNTIILAKRATEV